MPYTDDPPVELWIQPYNGDPNEREFLESLGIEVGEWDNYQDYFANCIVTREAMQKLDPYWSGRYIWGPMP